MSARQKASTELALNAMADTTDNALAADAFRVGHHLHRVGDVGRDVNRAARPNFAGPIFDSEPHGPTQHDDDLLMRMRMGGRTFAGLIAKHADLDVLACDQPPEPSRMFGRDEFFANSLKVIDRHRVLRLVRLPNEAKL